MDVTDPKAAIFFRNSFHGLRTSTQPISQAPGNRGQFSVVVMQPTPNQLSRMADQLNVMLPHAYFIQAAVSAIASGKGSARSVAWSGFSAFSAELEKRE